MIFDIIPKGGFPTCPNGDDKEIVDFLKKNEGKLCTMELKVVRNSKSNAQNRYFRGVIVKHWKQALWEAGYQSFTDEEYFQLLKQKFFSYCKSNKNFEQSTCNSDWDTEQWEKKMSDIRSWVFDTFNYIIPLPNEPPLD